MHIPKNIYFCRVKLLMSVSVYMKGKRVIESKYMYTIILAVQQTNVPTKAKTKPTPLPKSLFLLTKWLALLNRNQPERTQLNYCRTNPSQEKEGVQLFLSGCLHYSCKKLHAGQWNNSGKAEWGREGEKWHINKGRLQSIIGVIESVAPIHWLED